MLRSHKRGRADQGNRRHVVGGASLWIPSLIDMTQVGIRDVYKRHYPVVAARQQRMRLMLHRVGTNIVGQ